ncbi:MAG: IPT/TIG domain-containing protein [Acidimicrobiales bacterium]
MRTMRVVAVTAVLAVLGAGCAWYDVVSVDNTGDPGNGLSDFSYANATLNVDGQFVVFSSDADDLVGGDANGATDVFVRDLVNQSTERITGAEGGTNASISADGRYIAYVSQSGGVYVHDRNSGTATRQDLRWDGTDPAWPGYMPEISGNGQYVVFTSRDTLLLEPVLGNAVLNGRSNIFRRSISGGSLDLLSPGPLGIGGDGAGNEPTIDHDGSHVVYDSEATDLIGAGNDSNGQRDIFLWTGGTVSRISEGPGGVEADGANLSPIISGNGGFVVFVTNATNIAAGVPGATVPVVADLGTGLIENLGPVHAPGSGNGQRPTLSDDGRFVGFNTYLALNSGDPASGGAYVWDRLLDEVQFVGTDTNLTPVFNTGTPHLSRDGAYVAFSGGGFPDQIHARTALVPEPDTVSPPTIALGQTATYTITGRFFPSDAVVQINSNKVTVGTTTWVSGTELQVELTAGLNAPLTARNVSVEAPGLLGSSIGECAGCLTITP